MTFEKYLLQDNVKLLKQIFAAQAKGAKEYVKELVKQLNENNKELHLIQNGCKKIFE